MKHRITILLLSILLQHSIVARASDDGKSALHMMQIEWLLAAIGTRVFDQLANFIPHENASPTSTSSESSSHSPSMIPSTDGSNRPISKRGIEDAIDSIIAHQYIERRRPTERKKTTRREREGQDQDDCYLLMGQGRIYVTCDTYGSELSVEELMDTIVQDARNSSSATAQLLTTDRSILLLSMVIREMQDHPRKMRFAALKDAVKEIKLRYAAVSRFLKLSRLVHFNKKDDTFRLNSDWVEIPSYFVDGKKMKLERNCAYQVAKGVSPFKAIMDLYVKGKRSVLLDCSGAVLANAYGAFAFAEGQESFDRLMALHPNFMTISPMWAQFLFHKDKKERESQKNSRTKKREKRKKEKNEQKNYDDHPLLSLGYYAEVEVNNLRELLPGDIVYFANHPSYETYAPDGWWSGEWCVYLGVTQEGVQYYAGLGLDPITFEALIEKLRDEYEIDTDRSFPTETSALDGEEETIHGVYPSVERVIYTFIGYREGEALSSSRENNGNKKLQEKEE